MRALTLSILIALSGLLTVRVDEDGNVLGGRWLALRIEEPGVPKVDWSRESAALVNELSAEDFATPVALDEEGFFELSAE